MRKKFEKYKKIPKKRLVFGGIFGDPPEICLHFSGGKIDAITSF